MTDPARKPQVFLSSVLGDKPPSADASVIRLVAQREYSLRSLLELSNELTVSLDLYGIADLALFNLMGQLGTARGALWVVPETGSREFVVLRSHGVPKRLVRAVGAINGPRLVDALTADPEPVLVKNLTDHLEPSGLKLMEDAGLALIAPIAVRDELSGVIVLGKKVNGEEYEDVDLQSLRGAMGMLGVAMQNARLYNQLLEQHRQLRLANKNLEELDRLKSEFLRNVNHELRTPLTIIIAYTDALLSEEGQAGHRTEFLNTVQQESQKLNGLLERLLDFSAVMERTLHTQLKSQEVAPAVEEFYRERLPGVAESLREFILDTGDISGPTIFDAQRLYQILDTLLDNAMKFAPQGSQIHLSLSRVQDEGEFWTRIDVSDDGPGIPPDRMESLFEPFRQGDGSMRRTIGGMGVGLALARQLAQAMGGRLTASSDVGQGSRFSLWLAAVEAD